MAKDNYLKFRCTDKMKSTVESKAKENNMSVTAYLEYLIRRDVDTMRTVMRDNLTKDIEDRLKEEESCYLSSNKEWWLFTDMNVFNKISKEYKFNEETENRDKIYTHSVEECLEIICEDMTETFFEKQIQFSYFIESAMEVIEDESEKLYCNGWDEVLIDYIKVGVITSIGSDLEDELKRLDNNGYDIGIIKQAIDRVTSK